MGRDQALGGQLKQRLTNRDFADAVPGCDLILAQRRTRADLAAQDLVPQTRQQTIRLCLQKRLTADPFGRGGRAAWHVHAPGPGKIV
jgi:hypothetical protein